MFEKLSITSQKLEVVIIVHCIKPINVPTADNFVCNKHLKQKLLKFSLVFQLVFTSFDTASNLL